MLFSKEEWKKAQQYCWGISPTVSLIYTFDKLVKVMQDYAYMCYMSMMQNYCVTGSYTKLKVISCHSPLK